MIGGIIGGLVGLNAQKKGADAARSNYDAAVAAFSNITVPDIESQKIKLEELLSAGVLTPEQENEVKQQMSQLDSYKEDIQARDLQKNALLKMQGVSEEGFTPETKAEIELLRMNQARDQKGEQDAILQNMASRGMAGSGQELAARLLGSQAGAERSAKERLQLAAEANRAATEAIANTGSMAQNLRSSDLGVAESKARAADTINQFNTQLASGREQRNVGSRNEAQQANLSNKQRIMDTNVGTRNEQEKYNKALIQQKFENEMAKASGLAGQYTNKGKFETDSAAAKASQYAAIGAGVDKAGESAAKAIIASDATSKKNIKNADNQIQNLLDNISAYEFEYKNKKEDGSGKRLGVMAQDLEKSEMGKELVIDDNGKKKIDVNKLISTVLASQAHINKRLNKIEGSK